jgi:hypothetical protein
MYVEMVMALEYRLENSLVGKVRHSCRARRDHNLSIVGTVGAELSQLDLILHLLETCRAKSILAKATNF